MLSRTRSWKSSFQNWSYEKEFANFGTGQGEGELDRELYEMKWKIFSFPY